MSSIGKLMKQATRIQKDMEEAQAALANRTVESTSGGGAIKIVAKCDGTLQSIKLDPQVVSGDDISLLEDLILSSVNTALNEAKEVSNDEMGKLTSGLKIPGLMG
ncbi:MAG: YbaB/EbfC family nucleoid-associated protein [Verrucomicrobia bacterium]|jgi:nucleoid-associated protein EbfC|nr:YbaB/EbfC family nucleoid-associated protein [Verrucomicrobiota bacterium]MDB4745779.1 YbaB/EbfC family nucleoid-associated protein [Verrucomicrobiota bacterium]